MPGVGSVIRLLSADTVMVLGDTRHRADTYKKSIPPGKLLVFEHGSTFLGVSPSSLDVVISYSDLSVHTIELLSGLILLLKPSGLLVLYEPLKGRQLDTSEELSSRLLLAGFIDTRISSEGDMIEVSSVKPEWEMGASQKVDRKMNVAWSVAALEDADVIDEDSLLNEEARYTKPTTIRDDCAIGTKGKKACKNCTCGRAEVEGNANNNKLTLDMLNNPGVNSSCGSCGLGDAFRCGGCPYRGLPAFKVGEKITIPPSFLEDDL